MAGTGSCRVAAIKLAANYSPQLLEIRREHPGLCDLVKVSEFDAQRYLDDYARLRAENPLLLHGLGQSLDRPKPLGRIAPGHPAFRALFSPERLLDALAVTASPYLSVHLEYPDGVGEAFEELSFLTALVRDVAYLRQLSGLEVYLENIHFNRLSPGQPYQPPRMCAPDFIREALERTHSRFLLDISHAMIAASNRGEPASDYLGQLPLELVTEVHLAGPVMVEGELRDRHMEVGDEGFALLEIAIAATPVETVTLEYGGVGPLFAARSDPDALLRQLRRVRSIIAVGGA